MCNPSHLSSMPGRQRHRQLPRLRTVVAILVAALLVSAPGWSRPQQEFLSEARQLLQADQNRQALELLDAATEKTPLDANVEYLRGMALGRLDDPEGAQHAFLLAAGLAPGNPQVHRFAAISSFEMDDHDNAWEHAIVAARSGAAMKDVFDALRRVSEPPPGWVERLRSPLVYVHPADVTGLMATGSFRFADRAQGRDALSSAGQQVTLGDIPYDLTDDSPGGGMNSAADWGDTPVRKLADNGERIQEMMRQFRNTVAHAREIGLTLRPEAASYFLRIEVTRLSGAMAGRLVGCELMPGGAGSGPGWGDADVDTDVYEAAHPKELGGRLVLLDGRGFEVYSAALEMDNIASLADLNARVVRTVDHVATRLTTGGTGIGS